MGLRRRPLLAAAALAPFALLASLAPGGAAHAADAFDGDPFKSHPWPDIRREHFGRAKLVFDDRVQVQGPGFAEDPMNLPIGVRVQGLDGVVQISLLVDRNPIRKVLDHFPLAGTLPALAFRFELEQASPVRAAALTRDGVWHVGGTWVDSAGGGCTVSGATRKDGSWTATLGQASARLFPPVTWQQNGEQYVGVASGWGGAVPLWGGDVAKKVNYLEQGGSMGVFKLAK
jgi:sulfur-oxidizing protein SoxY